MRTLGLVMAIVVASGCGDSASIGGANQKTNASGEASSVPEPSVDPTEDATKSDDAVPSEPAHVEDSLVGPFTDAKAPDPAIATCLAAWAKAGGHPFPPGKRQAREVKIGSAVGGISNFEDGITKEPQLVKVTMEFGIVSGIASAMLRNPQGWYCFAFKAGVASGLLSVKAHCEAQLIEANIDTGIAGGLSNVSRFACPDAPLRDAKP